MFEEKLLTINYLRKGVSRLLAMLKKLPLALCLGRQPASFVQPRAAFNDPGWFLKMNQPNNFFFHPSRINSGFRQMCLLHWHRTSSVCESIGSVFYFLVTSRNQLSCLWPWKISTSAVRRKDYLAPIKKFQIIFKNNWV